MYLATVTIKPKDKDNFFFRNTGSYFHIKEYYHEPTPEEALNDFKAKFSNDFSKYNLYVKVSEKEIISKTYAGFEGA